jgi:hydroxymethylbilane synthase
LGTRGSALALWQANAVAERIAASGGPRCRLVVIKTTGDRLQEAPLSDEGGKRLFVKEIEDALLKKEIDLAVHSSKDMPAVLPVGLCVAGVLPREDPLDAIVLPRDSARKSTPNAAVGELTDIIARLGASPVIGTSSVRRIAQLVRLLPTARMRPIRGNVETRLRKLDSGEFDAIVLASAGLRRLGLGERISLGIPAPSCVPAPGQGIVAVETREDDAATRQIVSAISDRTANDALDAERAVVAALGGGCQIPLGALASPIGGGQLELISVVISLDGRRAIYANGRGPASDAVKIGARVGTDLLAQGAGEILEEARNEN